MVIVLLHIDYLAHIRLVEVMMVMLVVHVGYIMDFVYRNDYDRSGEGSSFFRCMRFSGGVLNGAGTISGTGLWTLSSKGDALGYLHEGFRILQKRLECIC
jgi:hypothetical protein